MTREEIIKKIKDEEFKIQQSQQNLENYRKELEMTLNDVPDYTGKYVKLCSDTITYYMYVKEQCLNGDQLVLTGFQFRESLYKNCDYNNIVFTNKGTLYLEMGDDGNYNVNVITKEEFDKSFDGRLINARASKEFYTQTNEKS